MDKKLLLGSHISMKAPNYLVGSVNEAFSYGANCFMIYTGAPQNTYRKDISLLKIDEFKTKLKLYDMDIKNVIVHAPYIINLANSINPDTYQLAKDFLKTEIERVSAIGIEIIVLHPGSSVKAPIDTALKYLVNGLNAVLDPNQKVKIAIETMAGKGSEVGVNFQQIKYILDNVKYPELVGVCWDTCHMNDADFDLRRNLENIIEEFDQLIGLDKLWVIHLNDSKNPLGSQKDRHENIGYGHIGFEALLNIVYHPKLQHIIKILETPWTDGYAPYKEEIEMIKNRQFNNFLNR